MEITKESHPFDYNISNEESYYSYDFNKIEVKIPLNEIISRLDGIAVYRTDEQHDAATYEYANCINKYGTVCPHGPILDTPKEISLELKLHQKRSLYQMNYLETYPYRFTDEEILILSDNVGSGKSLCMLSLIANNPTTTMSKNIYHPLCNDQGYINGAILAPSCIEFSSNLIVVPHGIYTQWDNYIIHHTKLTSISLGSILALNDLGKDKESIITKLNSVSVILIKSTVYNDFISYLSYYGFKQVVSFKKTDIVYNSESSEDKYNIYNDRVELITSNIDADIFKNEVITLSNKFEKDTNMDRSFPQFYNELSRLNKKFNDNKDIFKNNLKICKYTRVIYGFIFQRVIFDEADSIRIPSCKHYIGKKTWLITSSFMSLLYTHQNVYDYRKNEYIYPSNNMNGFVALKDSMVSLTNQDYRKRRLFKVIVRNHPEFVKQSIDVPLPIVKFIKCYTSDALNAVKNALSLDVLKALNAGDMDKASQILGCRINTEADIIDSVTESLDTSKRMLLLEIGEKKRNINEFCLMRDRLKESYFLMKEEYKNTPKELRPETYEQCKKEYYNIQARITSTEKAIETVNINILQIDHKIKNISDRLTDPEANTCPICIDNIKYPYALVTCCKNKFCIACISNNIKVKNSCPLCRTQLTYNNLIVVEEEKNDVIEKEDIILYEKIDMLSEYLLSNPTKKILIFSEFEKTFELIQQRLQQLAIKYSNISGNTHQILKTIDLYKKGDINVLMLNAKYFGAGINLQMTDEVFVYHRMSGDLEKQIIGRAQRLGRKDPLCINYLCYENEYDNSQFNENISN
jgi:hypothetical protein